MNNLLNVRELITEAILSLEVDPYADDKNFYKRMGYHEGLYKAKCIIDAYIDKDLENMANENAVRYSKNDSNALDEAAKYYNKGEARC